MFDLSVTDRLDRAEVRRLVVGYSGGLDSHVLLHLVRFAGLSSPIQALHVNHGLSPDANAWQRHCEQVCGNLGIPFAAMNVRVDTSRGSLEENARNARFDAFGGFLETGDLLLLAHHLDDQIETLLFYLFRGNSIFGVRGMPRERPLGRGVLFRPLLSTSRRDVARYAEQHGLEWIEDASNADVGMDRNYLRHEIIPAIKTRWPNLDQVLSRTIERDAEAIDLLDYYGNLDLDASLADDGGVSLDALRDMPGPRFKSVIRCWVRRLGLPWPGDAMLEEAFISMLTAGEHAMPLLAWQGVELRRFRDRMYLINSLADHDNLRSAELKPGETKNIAGGSLTTEKVKGRGLSVDGRLTLTVKFRRGGEKIKLVRSKTLKNLFQERLVPPWLRDRLPLIYLNDELVAVAGLPEWQVPAIVASDHEATGEREGWLFSFNIADRVISH